MKTSPSEGKKRKLKEKVIVKKFNPLERVTFSLKRFKIYHFFKELEKYGRNTKKFLKNIKNIMKGDLDKFYRKICQERHFLREILLMDKMCVQKRCRLMKLCSKLRLYFRS